MTSDLLPAASSTHMQPHRLQKCEPHEVCVCVCVSAVPTAGVAAGCHDSMCREGVQQHAGMAHAGWGQGYLSIGGGHAGSAAAFMRT